MSSEKNKLQQAVDAVAKYGTVAAAAKNLGIPRKTLSGQYNKALDKGFVSGAPMLSPDQEIALDSKLKMVVKEKRDIQNKYNELLKIYEQVKNQSSVVEQFANSIDYSDIDKISVVQDTSKSESTAVILCSDLHYEEIVDPDKVDNLNEYNPKIATKRFNTLFQNALRLVEINRTGANIRQCVLWLGGDLINGFIHPELIENNDMTPIESCIEVYKLCISAIDFLIENGKFEKITIVTNVGNHSRTTEKIRISTEVENSYEWLIYNFLANYYAKSPIIQFKLSKGYFNWLNVYGYDIRFHHGHSIKYGGGVGGLTVPMNRAIYNWNEARVAYLDCIGHWHQRMSSKNSIVNGSIVGYGPYSQFIKAAYEKPQQSFFLMHCRYGRTIEAPIFVE